MKTLGYKLIWRVGNERRSFNMKEDSGGLYPYLSLPYSTKFWTMAEEELYERGYHPTYFSSKEDALSFLEYCNLPSREGFELWKVEVRGEMKPKVVRKEVGYVFIFWTLYDLFNVLEERDWPKGTMMAKAIRLVERENIE